MNLEKENYGTLIKNLRIKTGLTQNQVAEANSHDSEVLQKIQKIIPEITRRVDFLKKEKYLCF